MLGLPWAAAVYHSVMDSDYDLNPVDRTEDNNRDRKRPRRSIFFAEPDSDSDEGDGYRDPNRNCHPDQYRGCFGKIQTASLGIPSTPYLADPLSKGACLLTPSFPRRSSSPCLESTSAFVAVHEEPNSVFRHYMEDRSAAMSAGGVAYLGIYDGHGGVDASTFLQQHLLPTIQAYLQPGCDVHDALTTAYMATNAAFRATGSIQGSTATTIILNSNHLIAANVGDSPAFVVKKSGEVCSVIKEHKIEGDEAARIAAQGVPIYRSPTGPAYMGTPDGTRWLNMSRAFGDFVYPAISCEPYVCSLDVSDGRFLVMGSDGLTEKWPVAEAAQHLEHLAKLGWSLAAMCRSLVEHSLARGSTDNISCMVVDLEAYMLHAETAIPTNRETSLVGPAGGDERNVKEGNLQQLPGGGSAAEPVANISYSKSSVVGGKDSEGAQGHRDSKQASSEQDGALLQLLCKEESFDNESHRCVVCFGRPLEGDMSVSAAALVNCAAHALGVTSEAGPEDLCWRRSEPHLAQACAGDAVADEPRLTDFALPSLQQNSCQADASSLPTRSSPDLYEKQGDLAQDADVLKGDRQTIPHSVQMACRMPACAPVDGTSSGACCGLPTSTVA